MANEYKTVDANQLRKIMRKFKYVFIHIDGLTYVRTVAPVDKKEFIRHVEICLDRYDYRYIIDDNYEVTLYIEGITRTEKQPAGETVDTPGPDLVP